jgi:hypothetical protein
MSTRPDEQHDSPGAPRPLPRPPTAEEWERRWQGYWARAGALDYELGAAGGADAGEAQERGFLTQARTPDGERERLRRFVEEFEQGFRRLYELGPAVTVFGSARFVDGTPEYERLFQKAQATALGGRL